MHLKNRFASVDHLLEIELRSSGTSKKLQLSSKESRPSAREHSAFRAADISSLPTGAVTKSRQLLWACQPDGLPGWHASAPLRLSHLFKAMRLVRPNARICFNFGVPSELH